MKDIQRILVRTGEIHKLNFLNVNTITFGLLGIFCVSLICQCSMQPPPISLSKVKWAMFSAFSQITNVALKALGRGGKGYSAEVVMSSGEGRMFSGKSFWAFYGQKKGFIVCERMGYLACEDLEEFSRGNRKWVSQGKTALWVGCKLQYITHSLIFFFSLPIQQQMHQGNIGRIRWVPFPGFLSPLLFLAYI